MEFIKHYWGFLVLFALITGAAAAIVYLLFFPSPKDPYAGSILVFYPGILKELLL